MKLINNIRSLLYVPGNSPKMLRKVMGLSQKPDCFVCDLEDSVHFSHKEEARNILSSFLEEEFFESSMLLTPRVNSTEDLLYDDLYTLSSERVDAFNVGKTSCSEDVIQICNMIEDIEKLKGISPGKIKIIPSIETAKGIVNALDICGCRPDRVIGVAFGADDYAADMGFTRFKGDYDGIIEKEFEFARQMIAVHARACDIQCFDTPHVHHNNLNSLQAESEIVKRIGFTGKFAIHPGQISILNDVFSISEEEYLLAKNVLDIYHQHVNDNSRGSCEVDGRMVDRPVVKRYEEVVRVYEIQKGIISEQE